MNLSITDRVALVTGAAGGLGVAESETLARAGGRVLMLDVEAERGRDAAAAINARLPAGAPPVRFVAADLADLAASAALAGRLSEEAGGIDILVNNAAVIPHKPIEDYGLDEYERIQRVNAHAAFALAGPISCPTSPPRARCSA